MSFLSRPLFLGIALCIVGVSTALPEFVLKYCSPDGNYTDSSTYQTNLNTLFSSLVSNTNITYGFYNFSYGQAPDIVYLIALCRGDLNLQECRSCVGDSTDRILRDCPYQKEAIGWYDNCMISYANKPIFSETEILCHYKFDNVSRPTEFAQALQNLMYGLKNEAAAGSSIRKYATRNTSGPDFLTIYGLAQCTPDLAQSQCIDCLDDAAQRLPWCSNGKVGGTIVTSSCYLRYETYRFYNATAPLPSPTPPPSLPSPPEDKKSSTTLIVIIVVVASSAAIVLLVICIVFFRRSKRAQKSPENVDSIGNADSLQFDFATIRVATDDFSDANKLGQGGFGAVYKGTLYNRQEVAVKRLSMESGQGDLEFKNEVLLVAKLHHRNLVRLLGFCLERNERLLVYEFVPNTSLDHFLFDPNKRQQLDWERRNKIIGGIARGLLYLHEDSPLRIIHRDLKASNVLLDAEMNAKISDFGIARLCLLDQSQDNTNRIIGTYGYMAPEYAMHGNFSIKSDVFSFGVLVLEIVCGRRNSYFHQEQKVDDLLSHAWKHWNEGSWSNLIDPIVRQGSTNEIMRCIHIGLLCVQENVAHRPTMASVVLMLNSYSVRLQVPSEPAFFVDSSSELNTLISRGQSSRGPNFIRAKNETSPLSANEASITELNPH